MKLYAIQCLGLNLFEVEVYIGAIDVDSMQYSMQKYVGSLRDAIFYTVY